MALAVHCVNTHGNSLLTFYFHFVSQTNKAERQHFELVSSYEGVGKGLPMKWFLFYLSDNQVAARPVKLFRKVWMESFSFLVY